eukprot:snap_masked-scaffold_14-processed-gene-6.29-mRNA-1 protein AED:1.00 eAED:1.00 QI:0/-1/0/0/-1/1/1/0/154
MFSKQFSKVFGCCVPVFHRSTTPVDNVPSKKKLSVGFHEKISEGLALEIDIDLVYNTQQKLLYSDLVNADEDALAEYNAEIDRKYIKYLEMAANRPVVIIPRTHQYRWKRDIVNYSGSISDSFSESSEDSSDESSDEEEGDGFTISIPKRALRK